MAGSRSAAGLGTYAPIVAAAVLSALTALAVAFWLPKGTLPSANIENNDDVQLGSMLQRVAPALLVLLVMFALASFEVAITLRGQQRLGWSQAQIGILFAECSAVMIVIQGFLFSMLVKHVSSGWLIGPGLGAMVLALTLMPFTADYGRLLLLVILISAGASVVAPMITYWASLGAGQASGFIKSPLVAALRLEPEALRRRRATPDSFLAQGAALGTQTAASSLGQALGSAAVAALFGVSSAAPFWLAATLLVAGATLLVTSGGARLRSVAA